MFPPAIRKPKRVGGAPFTAAPGARRGPPKMPLSARDAAARKAKTAEPAVLGEKPSSARCRPSSVGAVPSRGDGAVTPLTRRAEAYYARLMGRASSAGAEPCQEWTLVAELDTMDHISREERQRQFALEKQREHQAELRKQLEARNMIAAQCRVVWQQWGNELTEDAEAYKREEERKVKAKSDAQMQVRQEAEKNWQLARSRKAKLKEEETKIEMEIMAKATEAKKRQDEADEKRKIEQRDAMRQVYADAQKMEQERKLLREKELQQDIADQKRYEALLDLQERDRGKYFRSIREKQQKLLAKFEQGVGNERAGLERLDNERAQRQANERHEKERQEHEAQQRWRNELAESSRIAIEEQVEFKAQSRERELKEKQRFVHQKRREDEMAQAKECEIERRKKAAVLENAAFVRKQIEERGERAERVRQEKGHMNETERRLNRERLERACDATRADGLPMLLRRKRAEYLKTSREHATSMPC